MMLMEMHVFITIFFQIFWIPSQKLPMKFNICEKDPMRFKIAPYLHRDLVEMLLKNVNCSFKIWSVFDTKTERNSLTNHKIKQLQTTADTKCVSFQFLSILKDRSIRFGARLFKNHSAVQSFYFIHLWLWCLKCNENLEYCTHLSQISLWLVNRETIVTVARLIKILGMLIKYHCCIQGRFLS